MKRSALIIYTILLLALPLAAIADSSDIPSGSDWQQAATEARRSAKPIMILFSADDCSYCEQLKRELINPLLQQGKLEQLVVIREFNIDQGGKVTDFDGERVRSRIFVSRYDIFATPTILLVDRNGNPLASPLVGFSDPEDYRERLEQALEQARHAVVATASPQIAGHH